MTPPAATPLSALRAAFLDACAALGEPALTVLTEQDAGFLDADAYPPALALRLDVPALAALAEGGPLLSATVRLRVFAFARSQEDALARLLALDARLRPALRALPGVGRAAPPSGLTFLRADADAAVAQADWDATLAL